MSLRPLQTIGLVTCAALAANCASRPSYPAPEPPALMAERYSDLAGLAWSIEDQALYFSDLGADRLYRWTPGSQPRPWLDGTQRVGVLASSPDMGLMVGQQGRGNLGRLDLEHGDVQVLAASFDGQAFAAPRDLVVTDGGALYVATREGRVVRLDPDGDLEGLDLQAPVSALALGPEGRMLYACEAGGGMLRVLDLDEDGRVNGPPRDVAHVGRDARALAVAADGLIYVATRYGLDRVAPDGRVLEGVPHVRRGRAMTFGGPDGRTLFVATRSELWRLRCPTAGAGLETDG